MPSASKLVVTFPSSMTLVDTSSCSLSSASAVLSPTACSVATNVLTLTNPFGSSGTFSKGGSSFSFKFSSGGTNPDSVRDAGTFTVQTYATISSIDYPIDSSTFTNVFTPTAAVLVATVTPSSYVAYASGTTYTFSITPVKTIPAGGQITITFPTEVYSSALTACTITISGTTTSPTCTFSAGTSP